MAGEKILTGLIAQGGQIAWQKIYGILENAIYGGRVDNEFDMRVLRTYMKTIFQDDTMKGRQKLSGLISSPQSSNFNDFMQTIMRIPD